MVRTVSTGRPDCSTVFSVSAPVGHSFTHAPQDTQFDVTNPSCLPSSGREPATGLVGNARPIMVNANVP